MSHQQPVQFEQGKYVGKKVQEHTFGHIITSETCFTQGMSSEWHYHANPHFSHILSGGSKENRSRCTEVQGAGAGLYYHPGVAHQNVDYRPGTRIFNLELGDDFFRTFGISAPSSALMFEQQHTLNTQGLLQIMREHYLHDSESGLALEQLCLQLITAHQQQERVFPEWAEKIKEVLHDQWNQPLSLEMLAAQLDLHPVSISRSFARYFGCSAGDYLRKIKIEKALPLIRAGQQRLTAIAYECGFTDQAHFTRTFRHITGMLPKAYKSL
ncbi:helix-turn-helix transcriptional regulator [Chitinophaga sp. Mgbs1]|uniref:Helix-turn-helix transcriptional regulator n=1 Tax=Chitinophaga solisilvae TaxID=1233460 RepID=A0A3S1BI02_9BACT|nr:helix-turn-helix transcriptional regulator [Chitinophaga solisilvae]